MECIWEGEFENKYTPRRQLFSKKKKKKTLKPIKLWNLFSQTRLFHYLANANQKEALFPKSCAEVKAERRFLPKVQQSLDCATGKEKYNLFYLMDSCKWRGEACDGMSSWTVRVPRALAWFWTLSFSLCLYSCSCYSVIVGPRRLLKSHGITIQEVECTGWIQSCEINSTYPRWPGWKKTYICLVNVQSIKSCSQ